MNNHLRRRKGALFLLAAGLLIFSGAGAPAGGAFEETSVSARSSAMGGLFTALTDDVNSLYHNPAGLAGISRAEFGAQYSRLYVGLDDKSNLGYSFIGVVRPFKIKGKYDTLGAGWLRFALSGLYQENTFILSYATKRIHPRLDAGMNLKILRLTYGQDEYTANALSNDGLALGSADSLFKDHGTSRNNIDFDLGMKYRFAENYVTGFMIKNLIEPNMALDPTVSAKIPRIFKAGVAHRGNDFAVTVDGSLRQAPGGTDMEIAAGGEKNFAPGIAARGGIILGSRELMDFTAGLGYRFKEFDVDYALVYPVSGVKETMGTHRFSLLFRFGPVMRLKSDDVKALKAKVEQAKMQHQLAESLLANSRHEVEQLRAQLKKLLDQPAAAAAPVVVKPAPAPAVPAKPTIAAPEKTQAPVMQKPAEAAPKTTAVPVVNKSTSAAPATVKPKTPAPAPVTAAAPVINKTAPAVTKKAAAPVPPKPAAVVPNKPAAPVPDKPAPAAPAENSALQKDFNDAMANYRKMAVLGISVEERVDILKRIIRKFGNAGIDIAPARKELEGIAKPAN